MYAARARPPGAHHPPGAGRAAPGWSATASPIPRRAYQGAGGGVAAELIDDAGRAPSSATTQPDLTLIFDLPVEVGLARAVGARRRRGPVRGQGPGLPRAPARRLPGHRRAASRSAASSSTPTGDVGRRGRRVWAAVGAPSSADGLRVTRPSARHASTCDGAEAAEAAFLDALERGRLHHAWLLTGPEGVGKATFAYRAARRLLGARARSGARPAGRRARRSGQPAGRGPLAPRPAGAGARRSTDGKPRKSIPVDEARDLPEFFSKTPVAGAATAWPSSTPPTT